MDDPEIIAKHLPELGKLPILKGYTDDGKEILEEAKNKITLKMLLSHSSGKYIVEQGVNYADHHRSCLRVQQRATGQILRRTQITILIRPKCSSLGVCAPPPIRTGNSIPVRGRYRLGRLPSRSNYWSISRRILSKEHFQAVRGDFHFVFPTG
jgi:hypothetical protein